MDFFDVIIWFYTHLFVVGLGLNLVVLIRQQTSNFQYEVDNLIEVSNVMRRRCALYAVGFMLLAYGTFDFFEMIGFEENYRPWWVWLICIISGLLAFGAFVESKKAHPLAPSKFKE